MLENPLGYSSALADFRKARQQAALQQILGRLTGRDPALLSYDKASQAVGVTGRSDRGIQEIPVEAIVGSVGRYNDFTRTFLPRDESDERRWAQIAALAADTSLDALPPIEVYRLGEAYFVLDGNHRVSVARLQGLSHLRAHVIELRTRVPLTPDVQPDDLIVMAEQARFLERTRLDEQRPGADLHVTEAGQIERLEAEIEACRKHVEAELGTRQTLEEAAARWYDEIYIPVVEAIEARGILREFPNRTLTDLYLWISSHREELRERYGADLDAEQVVAGFAAEHAPAEGSGDGLRRLNTILPSELMAGPKTGRWREEKLATRYSDRLFNDLLVPLSGEPESWKAFEQALALARLEGARLRGLHVGAGSEAAGVREEFERRCGEAGVAGTCVIEANQTDIARAVAVRAAVTDLVVLNLAHPPEPYRLGSGFRAVIQRSPVPVLAVPETSPQIRRALLAYDGSPRAREGLFVATYLAEQHGVELLVLTAAHDGRTASEIAAEDEYVRHYLEVHEAPAEIVTRSGPTADVILQMAEERDSHLLLMGGYGLHPALGVVRGSALDMVLSRSRRPVLICR